MTTRIRLVLAALLAALVLALAACGSDDADTESGSASAPSDEGAAEDPGDDGDGDAPAGEADVPEAIVSLSPTATEMLFAIGAGDLVVAADDFSNFPEDAPTTDLSGFDPNLEAILTYEPDLVVLQNDANDVVAGLGEVGVETLILPAATTLEDTYDQLLSLGERTGTTEGAEEVVADMQAEIADLVAQVPERDEPLTYYHELDDTLFSVTSQTFIGEVYALAGLVNVADAADPEGESFGYPQLSAEFLVEADPDLVFLADTKCCAQDAETVAARPGFGDLTAVQEGRVIELDDDVASRWGPRIVDFLATIVEATALVEA